MLEVPVDPTDYKFKDVIELQQDQEWDSELATEAAYWANISGLPVIEAQSFARRYQELTTFDESAMDKMREGTARSLQKQWGDQYEKNLTACQEVIKSLGSEFEDFLNTSRLGDDHSEAYQHYKKTILSFIRNSRKRGQFYEKTHLTHTRL